MTAKWWRRLALFWIVYHLITDTVPSLLDLLGDFWGPLLVVPIIAGVAIAAVLTPVKPDKAKQVDRAR